MKTSFKAVVAGAMLAAATFSTAQAEETYKIAYIDPLSGPFAANGENAFKEWKYAVDHFINEQGGLMGKTKVEVLGFDTKMSPREALIQLKSAILQGARVVAQGTGSAVAHALTNAINKHNARNPDKQVLFLNFAAVDPALTEKLCNFWHFRFDAHSDMKMNALTEQIKGRPEIKKVYIIGQNYSFGKAVAASAVKMLKEKRPDIEIVGNELHPIGKVKDFTPYVTKIKASGAQAIITGNWGADMVGLAKAAAAAGIDADMYTYYAAGTGITAAIGEGGKDKIFQITEGFFNPVPEGPWNDYLTNYRKRHPETDLLQPRIAQATQTLQAAVEKAQSLDSVKVAKAMEGMEITTLYGVKMKMRADDHQMLLPLNITVHTNEDIKWDFDKSGWGTHVTATIPAEKVTLPTSCKMDRPS